MALPSSPTDGQTYVDPVTFVTYVYSSARTLWQRQAAPVSSTTNLNVYGTLDVTTNLTVGGKLEVNSVNAVSVKAVTLTTPSINASGSTGTSGQFLTSDGINSTWSTLGGGTGTSGQYLTSDGSNSYWSTPGQILTSNNLSSDTFFFPMSNSATGAWTNNVVSPNISYAPSSINPNLSYVVTFSGNNVIANTQTFVTTNTSIANSAVNLSGSGDFTIECWFKATANPFGNTYIEHLNGTIIQNGAHDYSGYTSPTYTINIQSGNLNFAIGNNYDTRSYTTPNNITKNVWYHVAMVRSGNGLLCFLNGQLQATVDCAGFSLAATQDFTIGARGLRWVYGAHDFFTGQIKDMRIVKGLAVYTSSFTPPTRPLTATQAANTNGIPSAAITGSQTSLLTLQNSTLIDNSTFGYIISSQAGTGGTSNNQVTCSQTAAEVFGSKGAIAYTNTSLTLAGDATIAANISSNNLILTGNTYYSSTNSGLVAGTNNPAYAVSFNGSNNYLYVPSSNGTGNTNPFDLANGAGNWTAECWFYANNMTTRGPILNKGWYEGSTNPSYGLFVVENANTVRFGIGDGGAGGTYYDAPISANTWYHAALVRNANAGLCFLNGNLVSTLNLSSFSMGDGGQPLTIGTQSTGTKNNYFGGYISNVRIAKGVAIYKSAFTPNTYPLPVVQKANTAANTNSVGLAWFATYPYNANTTQDGARGAYLNIKATLPSSNDFAFETGDWTVEGWYQQTNYTTYQQRLWTSSPGGSVNDESSGLSFENGVLQYDNPYSTVSVNSFSFAANTWYHVATVRQSGVTKIYVNGTVVASANDTYNQSANSMLFVGGRNTGYGGGWGESWIGKISNFRVVKGVAVYTGNFTVPYTNILTATQSASGNVAAISGTQTKALLYQSNTKTQDYSSYAKTASVSSQITMDGEVATNIFPAWSGDKTVLLSFQNNTIYDRSTLNNVILNMGTTPAPTFSITGAPFTTTVAGTFLYTGNTWLTTSITANTFTGTFSSVANTGYVGNFSGDQRLDISSNTVFNFGASSDFTIECWAYWPTAKGGNETLFDFSGDYRLILGVQPSGFRFYRNGNEYGANYSFSVNTWYHMAWVRRSSNFYLYINGVSVMTPFADTSDWSFNALSIGRNYDDYEAWTGKISNARVVKGVAVYTGDFNKPTGLLTASASANPFGGSNTVAITGAATSLLTLQNSTIIDNSSYNLTITNTLWSTVVTTSLNTSLPFSDQGNITYSTGKWNMGSINVGSISVTTIYANTYNGAFNGALAGGGANTGYVGSFNGSSQYLTTSASTALTPTDGTTPMTIEAWIYPQTYTNAFIVGSTYTGGTIPYYLHLGSSVGGSSGGVGNVVFSTYDGGWSGCVTTSAVPLNAWTHVAAVFDGTNMRIYINGVQAATAVQSLGTGGTNQVYVGRRWDYGELFTGYISNVRIVKGLAVYTGNFTVPTGPLQVTQLANPFGGNNTVAITGTATSLLTLQNSTIIDNSSYNLTITNNGTVTTSLNTSLAFSDQSSITYDGKWRTGSIGANGSISAATVSAPLINANTFTVSNKKAVNGPVFSAYANSTTQTLSSGSQQKVLFQVEEFDTDNNYANSTFTPTTEGYYQLNAEVRISGNTGTGESMITLWKNGSEYKRGWNASGVSWATNFYAMTVSTLVYANGIDDYFEVYVQQTSGGNRNITAANAPTITWFNGAMVRGA